MASPPKRDAWAPYDSPRVVLVRREGRTLKPYRGLVLDERVLSGRKYVYVVYYKDDGYPHPHTVMDWVLKAHCWPIHIDPNDYGRH